MPTTTEGFSQYLFADTLGKVVANTGGEKTISIVEMKSINQQLLEKSKLSAVNFSTKQISEELLKNAPLPTYSNHVDMQLSYGDFRIFIFPFVLFCLQHLRLAQQTLIKICLLNTFIWSDYYQNMNYKTKAADIGIYLY